MEPVEPEPAALHQAGPGVGPCQLALRVEVVYCAAPGHADRHLLQLPAGATLGQALQASGLLQRHPALAESALACGIWGRSRSQQHALQDGDRVEVYRPLRVDPKEARRERQRAQRRKPAPTAGAG